MLYSYEAKDAEGRTVTGSLEAKDERTATTLVRDQGYFLMRLAPTPPRNGMMAAPHSGNSAMVTAAPPYVAQGNSSAAIATQPQVYGGTATTYPFLDQPPMTVGRWFYEKIFRLLFTGINVRDLSLFYRQFATLINAGVPVVHSFDTLSASSANPTLRRCLHEMRGVVEAGGQISDSMLLFPWLFRADHRGLTIAGETSGTLDRMFNRISDSLEMENAFRQNIIKEITMPAVTLSAAFLLPPLYLIVTGQAHEYYVEAVQPLLLSIAVLLGIWMAGKLAANVQYASDAFVANIPGVAGTVRMICLARYCRTLASLYAAGVSMPNCIQYAAASCGNQYIGRKTLQAIPLMESGSGIVDAMMQTKIFPPMVITMLGIGETTGAVDVMMDKIAEHFEQESIVRLHQTMMAVRTIATIFIGYRVLMVLIKFYTGYYNALGLGPGTGNGAGGADGGPDGGLGN